MANYSLVIGSSFSPFSMLEMLAPWSMYKQEYDKLEEQSIALLEKADAFKYLSDNLPEDSKAKQIYDGYANDLSRYADDILKRGVNMSNQRGMTQMRRRYSGEIGRLEKAETLRKAQIEEQRKALLQNPTLLFSRSALTSSIDDYLDNPEMSYTPYSGALLTQRTALAAGALAKSLTEFGQGKPLDSYTNTWLQKHGFSANEVMQAINNPNDPSSSKVLNSIVENVVQSTPIPQWGDKGTLDLAYRYAREGLWQAVGQTQVTPFDNYGARLQAQMAKEKEMYQWKQQQEQALTNARAGSSDLNPLPLRSQQELSAANEEIEKYKQYFRTDAHGRVMLTGKGLQEYRRKVSSSLNHRAIAGEHIPSETDRDTDFKKFVDDKLGAGKYIGQGNHWQPGNVGNAWNRYVKANEKGSYDTYHSTEYYRPVSGDEATKWTEQVQGSSTNSKGEIELQPVDFSYQNYKSKNNAWKKHGNAITGDDVDKFKVIGISSSKYGATARMTDGKTVIRVPIKMGNISTQALQQSKANFEEADLWNQVAYSQYWPEINEYGKIRTRNGQIVWDTKHPITDLTEKQRMQNWAILNMQDALKIADYSNFSGTRTSKNGSNDVPNMN